jgi:hypothetical protein
VSQTARNEIETIRKKVGIARRKAKSVAEAPQQPEPQGLADENSLSGRAKLNPLQQQDAQRPNLEQQDLEYICRFFAMGGDDGGDDEHVWALLANQVRHPQHVPSYDLSHVV